MKAAEMGPRVLTLALVIPLQMGLWSALGISMTPRSKALCIRASTSVVLNSSEEGRAGQLDPEYAHILVLHFWSGWIQRLKNNHRKCIPVNPSCRSY
jgi:hypothetical protein